MLWKRALIALTLGPLALYLVYLGGWFYFLPITAVIILATYEYAHIMDKIELKWRPGSWPRPSCFSS
ncbi:MAG: hypothetical protein M5U34_26595 [Chloroflexi bacterium]|nr:hypothetical protein [Chloroflexota bacterium]